jgi:hypothetical protein
LRVWDDERRQESLLFRLVVSRQDGKLQVAERYEVRVAMASAPRPAARLGRTELGWMAERWYLPCFGEAQARCEERDPVVYLGDGKTVRNVRKVL